MERLSTVSLKDPASDTCNHTAQSRHLSPTTYTPPFVIYTDFHLLLSCCRAMHSMNRCWGGTDPPNIFHPPNDAWTGYRLLWFPGENGKLLDHVMHNCGTMHNDLGRSEPGSTCERKGLTHCPLCWWWTNTLL